MQKVTINIDQSVIQDCVTANQYSDLAFLFQEGGMWGDSIEHIGARQVISPEKAANESHNWTCRSSKVQFPTRQKVLNHLVSCFNFSFVLFISARHQETDAGTQTLSVQVMAVSFLFLSRSLSKLNDGRGFKSFP